MSAVSTNDFLKGLMERVTRQNARILLDSALVQAGITFGSELNQEQAKNLCLQLIKQGGPAFHVGQTMYRRTQVQ